MFLEKDGASELKQLSKMTVHLGFFGISVIMSVVLAKLRIAPSLTFQSVFRR